MKFKGAQSKLSKTEMKNIIAGGGHCLALGSPCMSNVDCCPNYCKHIGGGTFGVCANPD